MNVKLKPVESALAINPPRLRNAANHELPARHRRYLTKPDFFVSTEAEFEVDADTSGAIEQGIKAADEGRVVSNEEVQRPVPQWISKLSTPSLR